MNKSMSEIIDIKLLCLAGLPCQPPHHASKWPMPQEASSSPLMIRMEVTVAMAARWPAHWQCIDEGDSEQENWGRKHSTCSFSDIATVQTPCKDGVFSNSQILWLGKNLLHFTWVAYASTFSKPLFLIPFSFLTQCSLRSSVAWHFPLSKFRSLCNCHSLAKGWFFLL